MACIDRLIGAIFENVNVFLDPVDVIVLSITESFIETDNDRYRLIFVPSNSSAMLIGSNMENGVFEIFNHDVMRFIIRIIHNFELMIDFDPTDEQIEQCIHNIRHEYMLKRKDEQPYIVATNHEHHTILPNI